MHESPLKNIEIIVVDDCPTDGARDILKNEVESLVDKVIYQEKNGGKSLVLRTGFKAVSVDVVIV